ncbi:MAG: SMC-Scp complex subunit ScpB [Alphaproteobacteria bacterium]
MAKAKQKKVQDNHETLDALPEDIALQAAAEDMTEIEEEILEADLSEEALLDEDMAAAAEETSAEAEDGEEAEPKEMPAITQDDLRLVEAILFAAPHALTVQQIAERFPEDRIMLIPDVLEMLKEHYAARGVMLVQREKRWALRTATDLGHHLRLEKEQPKKFTRAAMETMAIIAYHQPVTRAEIENIRGVATSPGALDALMEAGWIKPGKRREVPGRPVTWLTTQAFLDHFGLEKLEDLPGMEELKAAGLLDKRPAIEAMPTADLFGDGETKEDIDPNEVTDEDLLGKPDANDEVSDTENDTVASGGDDDDEDEDADFDDEDGDEDEDEDFDEDEDSDASDDDDDGESDDGDDDSDDDDDEDSDEDDEDEDGERR